MGDHLWLKSPHDHYRSANKANSAFHLIGVDKLSSKLIQMCANLLRRRHLVNSYEMNAGWLIPFVDKRVGGR